MREKLIHILNELCPGVDFANETALVDDEILDSLDVMNLVAEIMHEFDVELSVADLLPENFNSVEAMERLIADRR